MKNIFTITLAFLIASSLTTAQETSFPILVCLGDSITKGYRSGVTKEETFSSQLEKFLLEKGTKAQVLNVGIGGERTDQALNRFEKDVASKKPAMVLIMYGANDSYIDKGKTTPRISKEQFATNLKELVQRSKKIGAIPLLMTSNSYGRKPTNNGADKNPNDLLSEYMEITKLVAKESNTPLIDHFEFWSLADKSGTDVSKWTTDQLHPNPLGHKKMAELILPIVLKNLAK